MRRQLFEFRLQPIPRQNTCQVMGAQATIAASLRPDAVKYQGSICALATPFDAGGAPDLEAYAGLVRWHAECGSHAVVVAGSTGESAALEEAEFERLLATALEHAGPRLRVIAGCGAAATHKALRLSQRAAATGAHASLVVTPYYVRPTQEGLYRHYAALAERGGLPLILYNVPSRTGCDLLPATVARLLAQTGVVGVKEARPEPARMDALLALRSERFAVLSGDDPTCARAVRAGADGVISVAANVVPRCFAALMHGAGRAEAAALELDRALEPLYQFLGAEPNPIPLKWLLHRLGRCGPGLRLPLTPLSAEHEAAGASCLELAAGLEQRASQRVAA
jgi:4-hydroxy-tetrahydrodipicolinate synthase